MIIPKGFKINNVKYGKSLFTTVSIKKDQCIALEKNYYFGSLNEVSKYAIEVKSGVFLDHLESNYLNFINHSCTPNMTYDIKKLGFFGICDIAPGTELTFDYDTTQSNMIKEKSWFICQCYSKNCKKVIIGSEFL